MKKVRNLLNRYKHGFIAVGYLCFYLLWFFRLEQQVTKNYTVIYMKWDDYIPFCEVFIIPYLLWFAYVACTVVFFIFKSKPDYYRACAFLFTGMTVFLIISTLWPNGHHLRPAEMPRDNIFTQLVAGLYSTDTATNLWPSIHVFNSLGAHIAIVKSDVFKKRRGICVASFILTISIVLSTVFLKQHSVFDVITAFIMAAILYVIVYKWDILEFIQNYRTKSKTKPQLQT